MATQPIQIEKGVPISTSGRHGAGNARFPLREMEIGDSFFVPTTEANHRSQRNIATNAANACKLRHGRGFTVRKVDGGLRVWRIS